jgi:hypothetical protein
VTAVPAKTLVESELEAAPPEDELRELTVEETRRGYLEQASRLGHELESSLGSAGEPLEEPASVEGGV